MQSHDLISKERWRLYVMITAYPEILDYTRVEYLDFRRCRCEYTIRGESKWLSRSPCHDMHLALRSMLV